MSYSQHLFKCNLCAEVYKTSFELHKLSCRYFNKNSSSALRSNPHQGISGSQSSEYGAGAPSQSRNSTFNLEQQRSSAATRSRSSAPGVKQTQLAPPKFKRSLLVNEFGTENKHGHLNCFLNVCLQALWQFPKVRADLQFMIDNHDAAGSEQLKPFVNSLQDFYRKIIASNNGDSNQEVPIFNSHQVRAELFKLNYNRNEFSLHEKADAFEALDQILGIIHTWQKSIEEKNGAQKTLSDAGKLYCEDDKICFIHQNFGQSHVSQELCTTCGARSPVRYQDSNVFAYAINVVDVLSLFNRRLIPEDIQYRLRDYGEEVQRVFSVHKYLVPSLKNLQKQERNGCAEDKNLKNHRTKTIACLEVNPEVFIFNASWNENPTPSQIFKFMISIPERFKSTEIFDDNPEDTYILRGIIAFQGAHYLSFFRRVYMKYDFLPVSDYSKIEQIHEKMKAEVGSQTEWTIFDDSVIDYRGSWRDVVKQCVDIRMYPTVIFYEKLDPNENQPEPLRSNEFSESQLMQQLRLSKEADQTWGVDGIDADYDQNDIAQQFELMNQFKKQTSSETGGKKLALQVNIDQEEVKAQPAQILSPAAGKTLTYQEVKQKYRDYGIYLFKCNDNNCEDGVFALHLRKCLKPGCNSVNHFVQESVCKDLKKWRECFIAITKLKNWKLEFSLPPQTASKPPIVEKPIPTPTQTFLFKTKSEEDNLQSNPRLESQQPKVQNGLSAPVQV